MLRKILILEHDEDDVYLTKAAFDELDINVELQVFGTATEMFQHIESCVNKKSELPSIIMLNYRTIAENSLEVVRKLKSSPICSAIPIIVGCGVVNDKIVRACYAEGISAFIRKPDSMAGIKQSIQNFVNYWQGAVLVTA